MEKKQRSINFFSNRSPPFATTADMLFYNYLNDAGTSITPFPGNGNISSGRYATIVVDTSSHPKPWIYKFFSQPHLLLVRPSFTSKS